MNERDCALLREDSWFKKKITAASCDLTGTTGLVHENTEGGAARRLVQDQNDVSDAVEYKFQNNILRVARNGSRR